MRRVKIHVTQEHLDKGSSRPGSCPIHYALEDAGFFGIDVGRVGFYDAWRRCILSDLTPLSAQRFIRANDNYKAQPGWRELPPPKAYHPFNFVLEVADGY